MKEQVSASTGEQISTWRRVFRLRRRIAESRFLDTLNDFAVTQLGDSRMPMTLGRSFRANRTAQSGWSDTQWADTTFDPH